MNLNGPGRPHARPPPAVAHAQQSTTGPVPGMRSSSLTAMGQERDGMGFMPPRDFFRPSQLPEPTSLHHDSSYLRQPLEQMTRAMRQRQVLMTVEQGERLALHDEAYKKQLKTLDDVVRIVMIKARDAVDEDNLLGRSVGAMIDAHLDHGRALLNLRAPADGKESAAVFFNRKERMTREPPVQLKIELAGHVTFLPTAHELLEELTCYNDPWLNHKVGKFYQDMADLAAARMQRYGRGPSQETLGRVVHLWRTYVESLCATPSLP